MPSILTSIKKLLGITEEYTQFDTDIIIHINSVFAILSQLGVGSPTGFSIEDSNKQWTDYIPASPTLELVKSYMHLKVRALFDPSQSSVVMDSINRMTQELEFRILVATESAE